MAKASMMNRDRSRAAEPPEEGAAVRLHPRAERAQHLRLIEAMLFAAGEPMSTEQLAKQLPQGSDVEGLLGDLARAYEARGVNVVQVAGRWTLRTAGDLGFLLRREAVEPKKLSRAALETLAIIAYHQPATRAEIEAVRGVAMSAGTLDLLLDIGWVRMRGRRRSPGRPITYGTTDAFLGHFGLNEIADLPGLQDLKGAGLLDANLPPGFEVPSPSLSDEPAPDEEPLPEAILPLDMHLPEGAEDGESD